MSDAAEDGEQHPLHQRIDITTQDLAHTRRSLQHILPDLAVPLGTEIHYTLDNQPYVDIYLSDAPEQAWKLGLGDS